MNYDDYVGWVWDGWVGLFHKITGEVLGFCPVDVGIGRYAMTEEVELFEREYMKPYIGISGEIVVVTGIHYGDEGFTYQFTTCNHVGRIDERAFKRKYIPV